MKVIQATLFTFSIFCFFSLTSCTRGQCDYPDDRARDGSRCGDRAASVRPGGRNPDTDWLVWLTLISVGIFVGAKVLGSTNTSSPSSNLKPSNTSRVVSNSQTRNAQSNHGLTRVGRADALPNLNQTIADKASTEKVIRRDFGYALDPMIISIFEGVVAEAARGGQNEYDAAIVYMMIQMNTLYAGSDGPKNFVDIHSHNILRILSKASENRSGYIETLNEIRGNHNLPKLN